MPNSDHNMHMDNPEGFANCIIKDLKMEIDHEFNNYSNAAWENREDNSNEWNEW